MVQRETPFILLTARRNEFKKPEDDKDDSNFAWIPRQFSMNKMKQLEDKLQASMRVQNRLEKRYRSEKEQSDMYQMQAESVEDENNNLKSTVRHLTKKNTQLERENQELYTLLQKLRGHGLEVEGQLGKELKDAVERGTDKAKSAHEIKMERLKQDEEEKKAVSRMQEDTGLDKNSIREIVEDVVRKELRREETQFSPKIIGEEEGEET